MIREDKLNHGYTEFPLDKYFPELVNLQTIVLWINVYYYNNNKRFYININYIIFKINCKAKDM